MLREVLTELSEQDLIDKLCASNVGVSVTFESAAKVQPDEYRTILSRFSVLG